MSIEAMKLALDALEWIKRVNAMDYEYQQKASEPITALRQAIEQAEKQEPIGYLCENAVGHKYFRWKKPTSTYNPVALYTAPPQREWVGLTDKEIFDAIRPLCQTDYVTDMLVDTSMNEYRAIEQKLKEKNHVN